jgi:hypothetical protein
MKVHPNVMHYISITNNTDRDLSPCDRIHAIRRYSPIKMPVPVLNRRQIADIVKRSEEQDRTGYFFRPLASLQKYRIRDGHIVTNRPYILPRSSHFCNSPLHQSCLMNRHLVPTSAEFEVSDKQLCARSGSLRLS